LASAFKLDGAIVHGDRLVFVGNPNGVTSGASAGGGAVTPFSTGTAWTIISTERVPALASGSTCLTRAAIAAIASRACLKRRLRQRQALLFRKAYQRDA
jgi:hypothetical protein